MPNSKSLASPTAAKHLTVHTVAELFGVSVATIWRWAQKNPAFPQPRKVGPRTTRWNSAEVAAWLEAAQ